MTSTNPRRFHMTPANPLASCRRTFRLCLLLAILVSGCRQNHHYKWSEYEIAPERVSLGALPTGTTVTLVNGQANSEEYELGSIGIHHYHGSLSELTDAVIHHLSQELERRGAAVRDDAPRTLEIAVVHADCETGFNLLRVDMKVRAKAGDGYLVEIPVSNRTPWTVPRGYDGAVALAVIRILSDSAIAGYLGQ